ncbi:hypothetical protein IWQ62_005296 [Dispira parvispora]|uniref:PHD-type domain-containing protein n=1 Tax=Dispira parvispora TaxID=1520584 RepID=A0A9W8AJ37_9FUNG|nr:hypothetical protein IWQ62_005296 [Dispira parvispora]
MAERILHAVLRQLITRILYLHTRYDRFHASTVAVLCDIFVKYLEQIARLAQWHAQESGRTRVEFHDVLVTLESSGISLADVHRWCHTMKWNGTSPKYLAAMEEREQWEQKLAGRIPRNVCSPEEGTEGTTLFSYVDLPLSHSFDASPSPSPPPTLSLNGGLQLESPADLSPELMDGDAFDNTFIHEEMGDSPLHDEWEDSHVHNESESRFLERFLGPTLSDVCWSETSLAGIPKHLPRPPRISVKPPDASEELSTKEPTPMDMDFVDIEVDDRPARAASAEPPPSATLSVEPPVSSPKPSTTTHDIENLMLDSSRSLPQGPGEDNVFNRTASFTTSKLSAMIRDIQIPQGITVTIGEESAVPSHPTGGDQSPITNVAKADEALVKLLGTSPSGALETNGLAVTGSLSHPTLDTESSVVPTAHAVLSPVGAQSQLDASLFEFEETVTGSPMVAEAPCFSLHGFVKSLTGHQHGMASVAVSRSASVHAHLPLTSANGEGPTLPRSLPKLKIISSTPNSERGLSPAPPTSSTPRIATLNTASRHSISIPSYMLESTTENAGSEARSQVPTPEPVIHRSPAEPQGAAHPSPHPRSSHAWSPTVPTETVGRVTTPSIRLVSRSPLVLSSSPAYPTEDLAFSPPASTPDTTTGSTGLGVPKIKIKLSTGSKPSTPSVQSPQPPDTPVRLSSPPQVDLPVEHIGPKQSPHRQRSRPRAGSKKRRKSSTSSSSAALTQVPIPPPPPPSQPPSLPIGEPTLPLPVVNQPPADITAEDIIHCVCSTPFLDDSSFMISCDRCQQWFHGRCVQMPPGSNPESWYCPRCQSSS